MAMLVLGHADMREIVQWFLDEKLLAREFAGQAEVVAIMQVREGHGKSIGDFEIQLRPHGGSPSRS